MKLATVRRFEHVNDEAARIALSDPQKYPGVIQEWAEMVIEKAAQKPQSALFQDHRAAQCSKQ